MEEKIVLEFLETKELFTKIDLFSNILKGLEMSFHLANSRNTYFEKASKAFDNLLDYYFDYWELYYQGYNEENHQQNNILFGHLKDLMELENVKKKWNKKVELHLIEPRFSDFISKHIHL